MPVARVSSHDSTLFRQVKFGISIRLRHVLIAPRELIVNGVAGDRLRDKGASGLKTSPFHVRLMNRSRPDPEVLLAKITADNLRRLVSRDWRENQPRQGSGS